MADAILERLETLRWTATENKACRFEVAPPAEVADLVLESGTLDDLRCILPMVHEIDEARPSVAVQRYGEGATIAPHTDDGAREARVVINLNRGWSIERGGIWVLSSRRDLSPPRRCLAPLSNTGFLFAPAAGTCHAMTCVTQGVSYAIIVAFSAGGGRQA